jgi:hypothetical protein
VGEVHKERIKAVSDLDKCRAIRFLHFKGVIFSSLFAAVRFCATFPAFDIFVPVAVIKGKPADQPW